MHTFRIRIMILPHFRHFSVSLRVLRKLFVCVMKIVLWNILRMDGALCYDRRVNERRLFPEYIFKAPVIKEEISCPSPASNATMESRPS